LIGSQLIASGLFFRRKFNPRIAAPATGESLAFPANYESTKSPKLPVHSCREKPSPIGHDLGASGDREIPDGRRGGAGGGD
jgi:hypothetical protein